MTIEQAKQKLIAWANAQIGTMEGPNNWNKYADSADLTKLYGWNVQNQPWCDVFVDAGFIACFGYDIGSAMTYQYAGCSGAACAQSANYYKSRGAWYQTPELGDQVFFLVGGGINHTGIVTSVGNGSIVTVEGNSSDMVARRSYAIGSQQIAGFGRPNWSLAANANTITIEQPQKAEEKPEPETCSVTLPYLEQGAKGDAVVAAQLLLAGRGYRCGVWGADGDFGSATKDAVIRFQKSRKLEADGVIGPETWGVLLGVST